ncbi:hypothetical protein Aspvir_004136 [Aspergillus viridinutans]|uniref:Uncharacterized protein n=1 Tax=Aspergillus viridinutans TaxID=75553 RepID=A0A9P3F3K5_ASPVI|nr:uncharacterized protein Aspvir_004136 [Aspergillus viridinutans]GIK00118.1 hypothetical protein Aspvir_004136 [Aspergillus viridinutans]
MATSQSLTAASTANSIQKKSQVLETLQIAGITSNHDDKFAIISVPPFIRVLSTGYFRASCGHAGVVLLHFGVKGGTAARKTWKDGQGSTIQQLKCAAWTFVQVAQFGKFLMAFKATAVGRVHRLGQRSRQKVWLIFQEHTISRWVECNNMLKALPELAA